MPPRESRAFAPRAAAALHRASFGAFFDMFGPPPAPFTLVGDTAVVDVSGPLMHHEDFWCDSYDAIGKRVDAALESPAKTLLLRIDSPGGLVSGCFELARSIRAKASAAGRRVVAYADGMACSGGYAIACAADEIFAPPTATIGSIGVLVAFVDVTRQDAMFGEKWTLFASGEEKADGNPHQEISPDAAARAQAEVNELSEMFFELVNEARHISVDDVRALRAGVMFGAKAKAAGLIDRVATFDDVLATIAGGGDPKETTAMAWKDDMRKAAKEGDEEAIKALAALDEESDEEKEQKRKDDEKAAKDAEEASAADGGDPAEDSAKKAARLAKLPMATRISLLEADNEKRNLLASRPDLPAAKRAELLGQPLSVVRFAVKELPKVTRTAPSPTPAAAPPVTAPSAHAAALTPGVMPHGAPSQLGATPLSEDAALTAQIDRAMGLNRDVVHGVKHEGNVVRFGTMRPEEAAARLAQIEADEAKARNESRRTA